MILRTKLLEIFHLSVPGPKELAKKSPQPPGCPEEMVRAGIERDILIKQFFETIEKGEEQQILKIKIKYRDVFRCLDRPSFAELSYVD